MAPSPLVFLAAAFILGILSAGMLKIDPRWVLMASTGVFGLAVFLFVLVRRGSAPVLFILFVLLGALLAGPDFEEQGRVFKPYWGHFVAIEGCVAGEPDVRSREVYYLIKPERLTMGDKKFSVGGRVLIRSASGGRVYDYGDRLMARGYLSIPDEPGNPGQFNYRSYLFRRGVGAVLSVNREDGIVRTGTGTGNPLVSLALGLKYRLLQVGEDTLPPEQAALLNGIVFGVRGELTSRDREIFSETGVNHILSVSGLHVGLLLGAVAGLLGAFKIPRPYHFFIITAILGAYALMTGLSPPVVRSTIMALVLLLGRHLGREAHWPTSMALAALIILLFNPAALADPGFQLSFTATWGILYLTPPVQGFLKDKFAVPHRPALFISVPLAAQMATLPLIAIHFNLVSAASIPANLLAVPLTGVILPLGAVAAIAGQLSLPLAGVINASTCALLDLFRWLVINIRDLPGAFFYVSSPSLIFVLAWYPWLLTLGGTDAAPGAKYPLPVSRKSVIVLLSLILLVSGWWAWRPGGNELKIHFIDVGQGDSIYVKFPNGRNMLVDTGGKKGEFISGKGAGDLVVSYLRRMGIKRIDALVLTHPHEDHAGGARAIVERFKIGIVLVSPWGLSPGGGDRAFNIGNVNGGDAPDPAYFKLISDISRDGIPVRLPRAFDMLKLDPGVGITFLSPGSEMFNGTRSDSNNNSLVMMLNYGREKILLTGDIEEEAQQGLLGDGVDIRCTVYKVSHHGSRYILPGFLEAAGPRISVISVGKNNSFGHPDPETLARLEELSDRLYRTDRDGAVVLSTDGEKLRIETGKRN